MEQKDKIQQIKNKIQQYKIESVLKEIRKCFVNQEKLIRKTELLPIHIERYNSKKNQDIEFNLQARKYKLWK